MEFLLANWQSVLVIAVFILVSGFLWFKGYKKEMSLVILKMIKIAEDRVKYHNSEFNYSHRGKHYSCNAEMIIHKNRITIDYKKEEQ